MSEIIIETPAIKHIGRLYDDLGQAKKVVVFYDENTEKLFSKEITQHLTEQNFNFLNLVVPASESSKSFETAFKLYGDLIRANVDRSWSVVAVGGGVVGDLGGFIAASFMRGIPVVQVPTTLLAMTDSSVGGKVAINHPLGKNMIGFFHLPIMILIDPSYLQSLPKREIYGGLAEVLKYALIIDREFLDYMEDYFEEIVSLKSPYIDEAIARSVDAKVKVVEEDFKEQTGMRAILNFGHTFAHAFEKLSNFEEMRHGEAVLLGMVCATYLSKILGNIDQDTTNRINDLILRFDIDKTLIKTYFLDMPPQLIFDSMKSDKKKANGYNRFTLLKEIGCAYLHYERIDEEDILEAIEQAKEVFR